MQKIEEAAEKGELTELVLMVIWNRLDLARRDVSYCPIILNKLVLVPLQFLGSLPDPFSRFLLPYEAKFISVFLSLLI